MRLTDSFGRVMTSLRLSVTDRCDLRCVYCMPAQGVEWLPRRDLLSFEEMERLVRVLAGLGLRRLRLTGGEPLLRRDLPALVERLARVPGIEDLSLTTNGTRLAPLAGALKDAGLHRVTVSLDSLDAGRFKAITRGADLGAVLAGLRAAEQAGLAPIKINCVVLPENEEDLLPLAALSMEHRWEIRFIEVMPVSSALGHGVKPGLPMEQLKSRLAGRWGGLEPVPTDAHAPARRFRLPRSLGKLGFISSVSEPFCGACDRLRLGPTGRLQLCMAHPDGLDLRPLLKSGLDDQGLAEALVAAVLRKPSGHAFYRGPQPQGLAMSRIGG
ncbi:MAG TPA: GTP 3',8-cyclase MoaA [bacterium]|nr:GTP 3',8-cyclase MoaA [bacterium]